MYVYMCLTCQILLSIYITWYIYVCIELGSSNTIISLNNSCIIKYFISNFFFFFIKPIVRLKIQVLQITFMRFYVNLIFLIYLLFVQK